MPKTEQCLFSCNKPSLSIRLKICVNFCPAAIKLHCPSIIYVYYRSQMLIRALRAKKDLYLSLGLDVICLRHNPR